jgi:hypothetical protein
MKRGSVGVCAVATALVAAGVSAAAASGAASGVAVGGITVFSADEVTGMCVGEGGLAYLELPNARRYSLALGDVGLYTPMPLADVLDALAEIGYPLEGIEAQVVILPVPRQGLVESSTEGSVVFLSPGRTGYPTAHVHYTVAHEIGHLVHHALLPGRDDPSWGRYAALRGLDLGAALSARDHASRLHEIFAEDFRSLFGGGLAQCGSGIENRDIALPQAVAGLREFFLSLPETWQYKVRLYASPNPFAGRMTIGAFSLGDGAAICGATICSVDGRAVVVLAPSGAAASELAWDGLDAQGCPAPPGMYFAVVQGVSQRAVLKLVKLP